MDKLNRLALAASLLSSVYASPTAGNPGTDDVPAMTAAATKSCGKGGVIQIPAGGEYAIGRVVDFTGYHDWTLNIKGAWELSNDMDYWYGKRAICDMHGIKTATIQSVTGTGVIDGNGQAAHEDVAKNTSYARPALHDIAGALLPSPSRTSKHIHLRLNSAHDPIAGSMHNTKSPSRMLQISSITFCIRREHKTAIIQSDASSRHENCNGCCANQA